MRDRNQRPGRNRSASHPPRSELHSRRRHSPRRDSREVGRSGRRTDCGRPPQSTRWRLSIFAGTSKGAAIPDVASWKWAASCSVSTNPVASGYLPPSHSNASMPWALGLFSQKDVTSSRPPLQDPELNGLQALGWYHSHLRSKIFLSERDRPIHFSHFWRSWPSNAGLSLSRRPSP